MLWRVDNFVWNYSLILGVKLDCILQLFEITIATQAQTIFIPLQNGPVKKVPRTSELRDQFLFLLYSWFILLTSSRVLQVFIALQDEEVLKKIFSEKNI